MYNKSITPLLLNGYALMILFSQSHEAEVFSSLLPNNFGIRDQVAAIFISNIYLQFTLFLEFSYLYS
jgi:hypothetical protein